MPISWKDNASESTLGRSYELPPQLLCGKPLAQSAYKSAYGAVQLKTIVNSAKVREIEDACLPESEKRDYEGTWGHATPLGEKNL